MVPRSGGQFSALIAKSCIEQVGGGGIEVVGELLWCSLASLRGGLALVASRPLQPRSRSRYNPCAAAAAIQSQSTAAAQHQRPGQGMSAKLSPAAAKSCHQQLQSCQAAVTRSPFHTSKTLSHLPCRPSLIKLPVLSPCRKSLPLKHLRRNNRIFDTKQ